MFNVLLVALGGGLGAAGRYGDSLTAPAQPGEWPWATFAINVAGSLLIGVLIGVLFLGETCGRIRLIATLLVLAGAALIRLG